jgi:hypothetical protein
MHIFYRTYTGIVSAICLYNVNVSSFMIFDYGERNGKISIFVMKVH